MTEPVLSALVPSSFSAILDILVMLVIFDLMSDSLALLLGIFFAGLRL